MNLSTCARDLEWIGCIDFGTTFSKFAMVVAADREELNRCDVQPLPISIGPDYRDLNEYLLPSVVFVTEDALLFSKEASDAAKRANGSVRSAFLSPKQYLSTFDLAQYDAPLPKEIDPTGQFTARNLLRLFMAHLLERAGAHAKAKDLPWPVPLRIARPAWAKERAKAGEKLLQDLVIKGFALVDRLGPALSKSGGLRHADALAAIKEAENAPGEPMATCSSLPATAARRCSRRRRWRPTPGANAGGGSWWSPISAAARPTSARS